MSRPSDEAASVLQVQRDERGVYTLTLNDPTRFNALGEAMLAALPALKAQMIQRAVPVTR